MLHSVCILLFRLLPESPRWLIVKGRNEEANRILHQFAKVNKTAYPAEELDITLVKPTSITIVLLYNYCLCAVPDKMILLSSETIFCHFQKEDKKYSIREVITTKAILQRIGTLSLGWYD